MIYLEQGQQVAEHDDLVVYDATGDYNNTDMVICAKQETPSLPYCRFEAQFIIYGGIVYAISDEKILLEEIQKIDPETSIAQETTDSMINQQEVTKTTQDFKEPEPEPSLVTDESDVAEETQEPVPGQTTTQPEQLDTSSEEDASVDGGELSS